MDETLGKFLDLIRPNIMTQVSNIASAIRDIGISGITY